MGRHLRMYRIYDNIAGVKYDFINSIKWNEQIGYLKRVYGDLCVVHTVKYKPRLCLIYKADKNN